VAAPPPARAGSFGDVCSSQLSALQAGRIVALTKEAEPTSRQAGNRGRTPSHDKAKSTICIHTCI
jgi:hypothetical protein